MLPPPGVECKLVNHSSEKNLVLIFSATTIIVLGWIHLQEKGRWKMGLPVLDGVSSEPVEHRQSLLLRHKILLESQ